MSINAQQRARTAAELQALAASLPVSEEDLAARLGYSVPEYRQVLAVDFVDPAQVWRVRDFLVAVADEAGIPAPEFSVLKDGMRRQAQGWFGRWDVPSSTGLVG